MNSGLNGLPSHFGKPNNLVGQALYVGSQELETNTIFFGPVKDVGVAAQNFKVSYGTVTLLDWQVRAAGLMKFGPTGNTTLDDFGNLNLVGGRITILNALQSQSPQSSFVVSSAWSYGWSSTTNVQLAPDTSLSRAAVGVVRASGSTVGTGGYLQWGGQARVSTQFDKTSDTTLANVTGLTVTVAAGRTYKFEATLFTSSNVLGGVQAAVAGTCTATSIIYEGEATAAAAIGAQTRATTLGTSVAGITAVTAARIDICGTITVNAGGTLTIQFAQNASTGTASSVLVGSTFLVYDMP